MTVPPDPRPVVGQAGRAGQAEPGHGLVESIPGARGSGGHCDGSRARSFDGAHTGRLGCGFGQGRTRGASQLGPQPARLVEQVDVAPAGPGEEAGRPHRAGAAASGRATDPDATAPLPRRGPAGLLPRGVAGVGLADRHARRLLGRPRLRPRCLLGPGDPEGASEVSGVSSPASLVGARRPRPVAVEQDRGGTTKTETCHESPLRAWHHLDEGLFTS